MGLREVGFSLPPGFRFHPSDEELVGHYLYNKVSNERASQGTMVEVDLHTQEPWELPEVAMLTAKEWYFFSFRDRKYATGSRTNRATKSGYWKATGKDRAIYSSEKLAMIGMRKTLVFYLGRAPNGAKTNWVMHEFRIETPHSPPKEDWVLCRVFHKKKMEEEKETSTTFYTSSAAAAAATPAALWNPVPFNEEVNGCSFSTITTYLEEDNKNSSDYTQNNNNNNTCLMQNFLLHDLTCYQKDMGPKSGDDEPYGLLWDVDFGHGDAHI